MSKRIFVNILNPTYTTVTTNRKGNAVGLGTTSPLASDVAAELGQRGNEIYFTREFLQEKKRKIQTVYDSFTDPKFFGDGSVNVNKVNAILQETLDADDVPLLIPSNFITDTIARNLNIITLGVSGIIGDNIQAGREDNAAPWRMKRIDFPRLTSQAIQGSPTRRSIRRLYDDRQLIGGRNRSTKYAIARLVREALGDALFSQIPVGGTTSLAATDHPAIEDNNALAQPKHFLFRDVTQGSDQTERTYVAAILYLKSYIQLIDNIINLQDLSLSRAVDTDTVEKSIEIEINLSTVAVPLFTALESAARQVIREKVLTFFDKDREYKTLLNLGDDKQYVAEAWRLAPANTGSVQLKLLNPLSTDIVEDTSVFISRELAQTVVDIVDFTLVPLVDNTPYLRPFNIDSSNQADAKMFATNATLNSLGLATGSAGAIVSGSATYGDSVFRRWFTGDFKSSELNIDFTDYANFVHFGSAQKRLDAFTQKLLKIEELTLASISSSVSSSTVSLFLKAQEKENIIRTLDPYEQFLYFATGPVSYSASAYYATDEIEYNATAYWPKQTDGTPYSPYNVTASNWLDVQSGIAQRYDLNNQNYIVYNIPTYLQEDSQSQDFLTLLAMVGHMLDNLKVYVDQFPNIYANTLDPLKDLSMDQAYEVAQSFGLKLPNVYALENLQTFNAQFTGETGSRAYASETWKRFLHSMVYLYKTKGSRTSFDALLNTYGISSPVLQIKETTYPSAGNYIQSEELTYGLTFTGSATNFVAIPLVSSSLSGSTIQLSFNPNLYRSSTLLTANGWAVDLIPHPSESKAEYGRLHIVSGSGRTVIASSSYFPLFGEDYTNLMLRSESGDFTVIQSDGDQILFQESASVTWGSLWNTTTIFYIGGSGSLKLANNFDGTVDEIRVWGEDISDDDFVSHAYDPGSFYASTYTSAYTDLFVHVPFSQPLTSITASVLNESPYQNVSIIPVLAAQGFTTESYTRISRNIKQFVPIVGSTVYSNKKITVASPPVFNQQFVDGNGTKRLSRLESIKKVEEKQYDSGQNIVSFAISPTDFINQNIIRSMGVVDVNNIIGSPRYIDGVGYTSLQNIQSDYLAYFNKTVNPNEYTRFFKDLVEGPGEAAETMVPARAKLLDGIVIESSVLARNKDKTVRSINVDGTSTKKFNRFVAGSGSIGIGAYDFELGESITVLPGTFGDTLPLDAFINVPDNVDFKESTKSSKLPYFRQIKQLVGTSYVTSSIMDENSSYSSLEALPIDATLSTDVVSTGYPRNPYVGITLRIPSEENTTTPYYDINPRSNFSDVGTTTYFHKPNGVYSYDIYTLYKTPYVVRLDTDSDSPLGRLYAPITLLPTGSIPLEYGRNTTIIAAPDLDYAPNSRTIGTIKIASIFSLYGIYGKDGLRIRFYKNETDQTADLTRNFYVPPALDAGVLFDTILEGEDDVFPYVMMQTEDSLIYYTIDNTTGSTISTDIIRLEYFAYEPDNLIPQGYLPRHYKYSRDNTIALKRRNYLGCRSVNRTFDGQRPFSVALSTENTVVVNSITIPSGTGPGTNQIPAQIDTIKLGGGGRLAVE